MKTYDNYKSSGIEWIGDIPEQWKTKRMRYIAYMKGRIGWQNLRADEFSFDQDLPYLITGMNFKEGKIRWDEVYHISEERYNEAPEIQLQEGDVLMTKDGTIGKLLLIENLPGKTSLNSHLLVIRSKYGDFQPKYLYYQLDSILFKHYIELTKSGTTFFGISQESVSKYPMLLPPIAEQTAIADFLDEQTEQIDKLIGNKKRLIKLLKEERTAIINQAVTKGINAGVKLKPSGIDWLGNIPEHWEVKRFKFVAKIKYGLGQPPNQKDDGLPLIRATNVERGRIVEKDLIFVDPEDIPYDRDPILKENDIIIVRSGAYTADSAIIPQKYDGAIAGYDMVARVYEDSPIFISYCLLSNYVLINQLYLERLRAAQPHLNKEELGETLILLPPIEEQNEIVEFIESKTNEIDSTISKIEKEIELIKEYRTALISEVVTGKIKVI